MKKNLLLFGLFIFSVSCSTDSYDDPTPSDDLPPEVNESSDWLGTSAQPYEGQQIVRLAWGIFPKKYISEEERFQELKNSGVTHCVDWRSYDVSTCENLLDNAEKVGIKVILNSSGMTSDPEAVVAHFKDHPALVGYYLGDEPDSDLFPGYGETADRIRAVDAANYVYVNLPRITHPDPQFGRGTEEYKNYLNDFIVKLNPKFLSYDNYTIYYPQSNNSIQLVIDPQMFENLEVIRDAALRENIDFWAFCNTSSHTVGSRLYPDPLLGHIRFYVYSSLAYGAQGIQYFTYWQAKPSDVPNVIGHYFLSAPILYEGKRGQIYSRLRTINEEIKNLSIVFAGAKVTWVRHTGSKPPIGTTKLTAELESTPVRKLQASGDLIVSLLEKEDKTYLVVVNRDPAKSIDLEIETQSTIKRMLKSGALTDPEDKLRITEGDAAIYTW